MPNSMIFGYITIYCSRTFSIMFIILVIFFLCIVACSKRIQNICVYVICVCVAVVHYSLFCVIIFFFSTQCGIDIGISIMCKIANC